MFIVDLAEELEQLDDEEERERRIELWADNRDTRLSEQGEVHSTVGDELKSLGADVFCGIDRLSFCLLVGGQLILVGPEIVLPSVAPNRFVRWSFHICQQAQNRIGWIDGNSTAVS